MKEQLSKGMEDKAAGKKKKNLDSSTDKEREKLNKFDPRGVQTLFRTLSRNHYNLLKMVDNKASIMLTINSILISLLMGAMYIAPESGKAIVKIGARLLINFSLVSMVFALFAMLPHRYKGRKYAKSGYKGSLYASNFAHQSLEEFKAEFKRIMNSGNTVYDEMLMDLYFLGKSIHRKQNILLISGGIFLAGLIVTFFTTVSVGFDFFKN